MILTPYKNGNEPGTWNLTQVNVKFCTLAELDSLSTPSIPFMVRYWSVDNARYLGVSFSKDLTWNTHINEIVTKANQTLGFVKCKNQISVSQRISL